MKQRKILLASIFGLLLFLTTTGTMFSQRSVQNISFFSTSLGTNRNVQMYLPQGYNPSDTAVKYPVIYFLHGAGTNDTGYSAIISILDGLISAQTIRPVIVVKPDGNVPQYSAGSFYTNSLLYGRFEDYIVNDLVTYVDNAYNTIRNRNQRCIMGHSMGGYGSMKAALKHPDVYRAVAAHSGPLDLNHVPDAVPYVLAETGGTPPYSYSPFAGLFSALTYTLAGAFSPNLSNFPYPVDFPLTSAGTLIDSTFAKWRVHNPARLASTLPSDSNIAIYFDCGMQDQLTLFGWNTAFRDSLNLLGLTYTFLPFTGTHQESLNTRFPISLAFLDSVMRGTPTEVVDKPSLAPGSIALYQNYPNPFNPTTTIRFSLPRSTHATVKIFTLLGQEVTTLVSRDYPAGSINIEWNATGMPSGVYFYRLHADDYVQTKMMVLAH